MFQVNREKGKIELSWCGTILSLSSRITKSQRALISNPKEHYSVTPDVFNKRKFLQVSSPSSTWEIMDWDLVFGSNPPHLEKFFQLSYEHFTKEVDVAMEKWSLFNTITRALRACQDVSISSIFQLQYSSSFHHFFCKELTFFSFSSNIYDLAGESSFRFRQVQGASGSTP